jgi:CxxC motif-containing protein
MIEKEIICVICPSSCHITVRGDGKTVSEVTGNGCPRGKEYATNEYIAPKRTLTSTVKAEGYSCPIIPVRSDRPIPKEKMMEAMEVIRGVVATGPFYIGKVVVKDILGTGANIVLTNC